MAKRDYEAWLKRAKSNLELAKSGKVRGVVYEDLCFEAQQSAEKALKALLIYFDRKFPKVHSFNVLIEGLRKYEIIPDYVQDVFELTDYAVQTRYPGAYYPVTREEYERAVLIASRVIRWVKKIIKPRR